VTVWTAPDAIVIDEPLGADEYVAHAALLREAIDGVTFG
jgi:hypothetical protein